MAKRPNSAGVASGACRQSMRLRNPMQPTPNGCHNAPSFVRAVVRKEQQAASLGMYSSDRALLILKPDVAELGIWRCFPFTLLLFIEKFERWRIIRLPRLSHGYRNRVER